MANLCSVCGGDHPSTKHMPSVKRLDTRYRIEYVEHKELIAMLQAAHDYAAANEHRADYWTCMAAYLAGEGLSYRYDPPKGPVFDFELEERK